MQKCIDRQSSALSLTVRERENYIFPQDFKLQMFLAALRERLGYQSALLILSASTRNLCCKADTETQSVRQIILNIVIIIYYCWSNGEGEQYFKIAYKDSEMTIRDSKQARKEESGLK